MHCRLLITLLTLCFSTSFFAQEPKLMLPIGHSLGVATAVFNPDAKRVVTSSLDNNVIIWEVSSGQILANLRGHSDTVLTAIYSPDGKKIVTAAEDGLVKIWDAVSTNQLSDLKGHTNKVYAAEFSPDGEKILTASEDNTAKVWETETGKLLLDLKGHTKGIWPARFSRDGKKIITASYDSTVKVWDASSGKLLLDLKGHSGSASDAIFSYDGKKIVTCSADSTAKVWDAETGKLLFDLKEHKDAVTFASFNPDGKKILTGSDDGYAKIWDSETGNVLFTLLGKKKNPGVDKYANYYPDIVMATQFSPDGKMILTAYMDSIAKLWDAETGKLLKEIKKNYEYINSANFSPDGKKIALALAIHHAEIRDVNSGALVSDLKGKANPVQTPTFSKDGKRILLSAGFGSPKLIDASTGEIIALLTSGSGLAQFESATFSPDEKKIIVTGPMVNSPRVYDARTGIYLFELKGHTKGSYGGFSRDTSRIITYSRDSTARVWDTFTGKQIAVYKGKKPDDFLGFWFNKDKKKIISRSQVNGTISVWDVETGQQLKEIKAHEKFIPFIQLTPDRNKILTTSDDSTAKVWDAETITLLYTIKEPGRRIRFGNISPDGSRIYLTLSEKINGTIITKLWDTETGKYITQLNMEGAVPDLNISFFENGKKAYSGMSDGSLKIWDAKTGELINNFKRIKESNQSEIYGFTPDGKQIIITSDVGDIKFYDAESGKYIRELKGHNFKISKVTFSPDGKRIFTASLDNTIKVWDAGSGKELLTYISIGEEDYLVLDNENHFDGTEAARKLLYFTCGTEVIELDQVKDQLWVPNLAERITNGESINAQKLSDLNICNLTPVVETIEQTALQYRFQITPRLGGLSASIVYVNGIEVKRYMPQQLTQQQGVYQLSIDKKELQQFFVSGKENSIVVKSLTAKTSISSRSGTLSEKRAETIAALPNLYAVVVGVSDYKGEELDLNFAAKDAVDIANALDISAKKLLNTDGKEHVFITRIHTGAGRDKFPEKNSIRQAFTDIAARAKPNDILLIFFAGHGVMEAEKNQFYFLTADASNVTVSGALKNVGISTDELTEWIKPQVMRAQKRILIFDACNSGQVLQEILSVGQIGQNFQSVSGDFKGKQIKAIDKLNERSGMFILAASASDQKAYEIGKYNQGALTYSLLKAIKEQPDILEDRKFLNLSRWFTAAEKSVEDLARETGARQQPQLVSTTNFNIGVVDEEVRNKITLPFEKPMFTRSDFRNTATAIDNLKLRSLVDKELIELSYQGNASLMYSPEYEGQNVYQLSGSYTINGSDIIVAIIITQGGTEIKTKFEVKGKTENLALLSTAIITAVKEWIENKK